MSFNKEQLVQGTKLIMEALNMSLTDSATCETPDRVARMLCEICLPEQEIQERAKKLLDKTFDSEYDGMIISSKIRAYGLCEHHLLPIVIDAMIGYVPDKKVLGLSKLARLVDLLAKRPMIQENYTAAIAKTMMRVLAPKGVGVYVSGLHYCQTMRGARQQHAEMVTTEVLGCFREDARTRSEFLEEARARL